MEEMELIKKWYIDKGFIVDTKNCEGFTSYEVIMEFDEFDYEKAFETFEAMKEGLEDNEYINISLMWLWEDDNTIYDSVSYETYYKEAD